MVPVRHVDDGFIRRFRTRQQRQHVAGLFLGGGALQAHAHLRRHRHRLEAAFARGRAHLFQIHPGVREQRLCLLAGDPALQRHARRRVVGRAQIVLRAGPRILHHVPTV